jgi:hypothetical protein
MSTRLAGSVCAGPASVRSSAMNTPTTSGGLDAGAVA